MAHGNGIYRRETREKAPTRVPRTVGHPTAGYQLRALFAPRLLASTSLITSTLGLRMIDAKHVN